MQTLSWPSIASYCAFAVFIFYQQLHVKTFQGGSQSFALALNASAFAGMVTGLAYLVYYGWSVVWWAPTLIFSIGLLVVIPAFLVERFVGSLALSLSGFIGWPICAYLMFHYMPS